MSMDNISVGGVRLFAKGTLAQLAGGLLAILFVGLNIQPESTMLNVLACIPVLAIFPLNIGLITYRLAKKLGGKRKEIEKINVEIRDSNVKLTAAYEGLQESERRYRTLYESSRDGIVKTDMEGRFVEFNQSYLEMLGYTADELMGRSYK
jgi:PAS domain-containing protein